MLGVATAAGGIFGTDSSFHVKNSKGEVVRQLVYTVFIRNNHASFHLW